MSGSYVRREGRLHRPFASDKSEKAPNRPPETKLNQSAKSHKEDANQLQAGQALMALTRHEKPAKTRALTANSTALTPHHFLK
jgi:hypothetical protein